MIAESLILNFTLSLWKCIKTAYGHSMTSLFLKRVSDVFKAWMEGSSVWQFVKRNDFYTRVWEYSFLFSSLQTSTDAVLKAGRSIYTQSAAILEESIFFKLLYKLLLRFEMVISAAVACMVVIPHSLGTRALWYNGYGMVIIFTLAFLYLIKIMIHKHEQLHIRHLDVMLVIFMCSVVLGEVTSLFPRESLNSFVFLVACFVLMLVIMNCIQTAKSLNNLLEGILTGISFTGLYAIYQTIQGIPTNPALTDLTLNSGMGGRAYSTMGNPNNYAELLILSLPFFFAVILNARSVKRKLVFSILAVPPLIGLLLTQSRSAWGAFAIAVMVFVFFKNRKLIPLIIVLGLASIPFLPQSIYRRIMTLITGNDTSAEYRVFILKTIWPMYKDFWLTGLGLGPEVFMKILQRYPLVGKMEVTPPHSHNLFLQVWIETGLVGMVSFIWFIIRLIKKSMLNIFKQSDERVKHVLMAGSAALAGICIMGMAEYVWFYPRVMIFFWLIIGIILAALGIVTRRQEGLAKNK